MQWGVPKQKRHCAVYGGISHQVIIVQKHKDFVIDVGQVIYQHRTIVCAWTREVSSIRPICASPGQSVGAELLLAVLHQPCGSRTRQVGGVPVPADIPRRQRPDPCCRRSAPASDPAPRGTEGSNPSPSSGKSSTNLRALRKKEPRGSGAEEFFAARETNGSKGATRYLISVSAPSASARYGRIWPKSS